MPLPAGTRLGPYEVLAAIGAGGMGEVYRARDERLDRLVALKVLPRAVAQDSAARARFDREARAIAAAHHPNICVVHDVGHADDVDYLVMELLEGETLAATILRGPLPLDRVVDYGIALSDALASAHGRGLIHRDLKPANVFVTTHDVPKILDFGLAKIAVASDATTAIGEAPLTESGTSMGTLAYMSPEQLRAEPLDAGTDVFSFGLVLFEMATGRRAFNGPTSVAVAAAILGQAAPDSRTLRPDLPPALAQTIAKCLEKDRRLRTQSAAELRAELSRLKRELASPAVEAVVRPQPRRAWMLAAGAAVLVLGAVGYEIGRERTPAGPPQPAGSPVSERPEVPTAGAAVVSAPVAPAVAAPSAPDGATSSGASRLAAEGKSAGAGLGATPASAPVAPASPSSTPAGPGGTTIPGPPPAPTLPTATALTPTGSSAISAAGLERPPARPPAAVAPVFDLQPLPNSGRASLGVISPDGKFVAYRRIDGGVYSVWGRRLATSEEFPIVTFPLDRRVFGLTITPDSAAVDLVVRPVDARTAALGTPELVRVQIVGGSRMTPATNVWSLVGWSPDRKQIAYVDSEPGWVVLKVIDADGSHPRVVARRSMPTMYNMLASSSPLNRPAWSPDSKSIALVGISQGQHVVVVDVATGKEQVFGSVDVPLIDSLVWFDAERLVFTRTTAETTNHQVWTLNVRTRELTQITRDVSAYSGLSITDDGSAVASTRVTTAGGIWARDKPGGTMTQIVADGGPAPTSVSVSNSGRVVYGAGANIWTLDTPTSTARMVVRSGLTPVLAPDASTVVYSDVLRTSLFRVPPDGSNPKKIVDGDAREPTTDGKTVFFTSVRGGSFTIWAVSIDGGLPRQVVDEPSTTAQVSPDGKRLLFASTVGWRVCTLPECKDRQSVTMATKWAPDGGFGYASGADVWVRPQGSSTGKATTTFSERNLSSFNWSPDGKRLVVVRSTISSDLVLLTLKPR